MKPKQIIISILAVLFVFPLMGTFAQQAASSGSIEVITTFDYPGAGNATFPQKINERGDVVGEFIDSSGVTRGFIRFSNGSFSDPIVDPNDTVGFTEGRGINNSRTVAGDYVISDGTIHSFFLSGGTFTEYDVPGAVQTNLLSINDAATLPATFDDGSGIFQAFVGRGGTITSFSVPGALGPLLTRSIIQTISGGILYRRLSNPSRLLPGRQWGAALPDRSFRLHCDSPVWT